ncbi:MAG: hypothetical protein LBB56_04700 [Chitinispirillales bacterium]|jgi:hypothetical protein|nr:hypothetical protein [Chitinispirillales bacterium]
MAALSSYVERMPMMYRHRYSAQWVQWANNLLERLSGAGYLPPQLLTRGVEVHNEVWIDRPFGSRDITELRNSRDQSYKYRFAEENNQLRLTDVRIPESEKVSFPVVGGNVYGVVVKEPSLEENRLKGMLFVVTSGAFAWQTFIVGGNMKADEDTGEAHVFFLHPSLNTVSDSDAEQNTFYIDDDDKDQVTTGYFVPQDGYLIVAFIAAFAPVRSLSDDLGIDGYENLVDAWLRWKVEEQISALSQECAYWHQRVESEMSNLRAEKFNRMNKPRGRRLIGFES